MVRLEKFKTLYETTFMIRVSAKNISQIEASVLFDQDYPYRVTWSVNDVYLVKLFFAISGSASNIFEKQAKHQCIAAMGSPHPKILLIKKDQISWYLSSNASIDSVSDMYYKPILDRQQLMKELKIVQWNGDDHSKNN